MGSGTPTGTHRAQGQPAKELIAQFLSCPDNALLGFLREFRERPKFKVCFSALRSTREPAPAQEDFVHWIDVFDRFDDILARAAPSPASSSSDASFMAIYNLGDVCSVSFLGRLLTRAARRHRHGGASGLVPAHRGQRQQELQSVRLH